MKVLAVHDAKGNVSGFVVHPVDGPPGAVILGRGDQMTEVEVPPEIKLDLTGDDDSMERLADVLRTFHVEVTSTARLVRREPSKGK